MKKFSLTPSHIIEYLFCPRFTYFEYVLRIPQQEDKFYKVQKGRLVHENKTLQNANYLRARIGVVEKLQNQYLTNDFLRGEVDEVLTLQDGSQAPLDYKFAQYKEKVYSTYKTQLFCYAILIEANYGTSVDRGYLVYTRSKNKLIEVRITASDKKKVLADAENIMDIMSNNRYPKATSYKKRCLTCTFRNVCTK